VEHHPCDNLASFVDRQNRYTSLQAEELFRTLGRASDRRLRKLLWRTPWKTFWKSYVKKSGYREGVHGLVFAEFYAGIELLKWAKVWEHTRLHPNTTVGSGLGVQGSGISVAVAQSPKPSAQSRSSP